MKWLPIYHLVRHYLKFYRHPNRKALMDQTKRTLIKKSNQNKGIIYLIDILTKYKKFIKNQQALFVGCRNEFELNYFKKYHQARVVGIDLYSESKQIKIMDMHQMKFKNNSFDLIFASHVLEHAYDIKKVIAEFIRIIKTHGYILIEVPVNYQTNEIDIIDFINVSNIKKLFRNVNIKVIWQREAKNKNPENYHETDLVSVILQILK